jgi:hypothetical protein
MGSNPDDDGSFKGDKNPLHNFVWRENKAVGLMSQDF